MPFLGRIPIYEPIRIGGDTGVPITVGDPQSAAARALRSAAEQLAAQLSIATFNSSSEKGDSTCHAMDHAMCTIAPEVPVRCREVGRRAIARSAQPVHREGSEDRARHEQQERPPPPEAAATSGSSRMLTIVSRKPAQVCSVSAVPTCVRGLYSATSAENCAESATTENPQTTANSSRIASGAAVEQAGSSRAGGARQQRAAGDARLAPAVRPEPGHHASGRAAADRDERDERSVRRRPRRLPSAKPRRTQQSTPTSRTAPTCDPDNRASPGARRGCGAPRRRHGDRTARTR